MRPWSLLVFLTIASGALAGAVESGRASGSPDDLGGYYDYKTWQTRVDGDRFTTDYRVRLTILNARGSRYAGLSVQEDKYQRISDLKIRVLDANDKLVYDRKRKDMTKVCGFGPGLALYQDVCTYLVDLPGPSYPYHIEIEYRAEVSPLFFLGGDAFQDRLPVQSAVYELRWPADRTLHYRTLNMEVTPSEVTDGKWVRYRWEAHDLPAVSDEWHMPPRDRMPAQLVFSPDRFEFEGFRFDDWSWNGVGRWYNEVAAECYLPGAGDDRNQAADPLAAMRAAYVRVVGANRYVSVAIGIGGWQPHKAASVEEKAYGDCKDLSTLLISYLRQAGVHANPALVLTRDVGVIDRDFPAFAFNHVVTAAFAGTDTVWMDPTCNVCPFGVLPSADEDIDVLLMDDSGGTVVRTPGSTADQNHLVRRTHVYLQRDKTYRVESEFRMTGNVALSYRGEFDYGSAEDQRQFVLGLLPEHGHSVQLIEYGFRTGDADDVDAVLKIHFETSRPLDNVNGTWYLPLDFYGDGFVIKSVDLEDRTVPIDFGYPRAITDEVLVTWKGCPAFDDISSPADRSADCGVLSCRLSAERFDDSLRVTIERRVNSYELPVDKFEVLSGVRGDFERVRGGTLKFHEAADRGGK